jgi:hypothetical protein
MNCVRWRNTNFPELSFNAILRVEDQRSDIAGRLPMTQHEVRLLVYGCREDALPAGFGRWLRRYMWLVD